MIIIVNNYPYTDGPAIAIPGEVYTIRTNQKYYHNAVYSGNGIFTIQENGEIKRTSIWNEKTNEPKKNFAVFAHEPESEIEAFIKKNKNLFINKSVKDKPEEKILTEIYNTLLQKSKTNLNSVYNTEENYKVKGVTKTRIVPTTPPINLDKHENSYSPEALQKISDKAKTLNPDQISEVFF